jgi:hypothetical protein
MVNYNNGKIYKIEPNCEHEEEEIYIGSTTKEYLSQRMEKHRSSYKYWKEGKCGKTNSFILFEKYGVENCNIILLEYINAQSKDELTAKEAEYIKNYKCINKFLPFQTNEERKDKKQTYLLQNKDKVQKIKKEYYEKNKDKIKEYRENNKDKMQEYNKEYREKNKDKMQEYDKEYREKNKDKIKEYGEEYREKNKDKIQKIKKEYSKEYREKNKDKIKEQKSQKDNCPHCDVLMLKRCIGRHIKRKHLN